MLTPQLKPTIDINMLCFIRSGVFGIAIKAPWYFCNIPLEVVHNYLEINKNFKIKKGVGVAMNSKETSSKLTI